MKIKDLFKNIKFIKIQIFGLILVSFILGIIFDLTRLENPLSANLIMLRPKYLGEWNWDPWFNVITVILAFIDAIYAFFIIKTLKRIKQPSYSMSENQKMLYLIFLMMIFGRINEGLYILFTSDYISTLDAFGEIYIILDLISVVILTNIVSDIFIDTDFMKNSKIAQNYSLILSLFLYIGYLFLILFSYDPELYNSAIIVAFITYFTTAVVIIFIVIQVFRVANLTTKYKEDLIKIGVILILFILEILLLISCGLTATEIPKNQVPNRLFRFSRMILFFVILYLFKQIYLKNKTLEK
ncbi:MAG: hypothetical protein ACTSRZ_15930 [Promethearchaeota archaeon]